MVFLLSVILLTGQAFAHSARTNASGCHAGKLPYHCHNSKTPYRPSVPSEASYPDKEERKTSYPDYKTGEREPPPKSLVVELYDKITGSIAYSLRLIQKKPSVVQSCEEWVMVMKLMSTIRAVSPRRLASLEGKCYDTGYRRFSKYMVKLIDRLPI